MREQPWLSISALAAAIAGIGLGIAALILVLDEDSPPANLAFGNQPFGSAAPLRAPGSPGERELPKFIERALEEAGADGAWLGVVAKDAEAGVAVSAVAPGSPAEKAGINEGDVIRSVDGEAVADSPTLGEAIAAHEAGDRVQVEVERGGERETVEATLEARPPATDGRGGSMGPSDGGHGFLLPGLDLVDLPTQIISGELVIENAEGEKQTYRLVSGSVREVTEERLIVAPEEGEATTFAIGQETIILPRREDLTAGDQVLVVGS